MKIKLYVDNHKISEGVPFVLETDDPKVGTLYAAKVTVMGPVSTEFDPNGIRPNCFVVAKGVRKIHMNKNHEALVTFNSRLD